MNCVILQPSYIPWRGYFHQIAKADIFVFLDDAQYDKRGWRNRNRIKTERGSRWLSIPVYNKGARTEHIPISKIAICWDTPWNHDHWQTLKHAYSKAPYFHKYTAFLEPFYQRHDTYLVDLTIDLIIAISRELGINHTRFIRSSSLQTAEGKNERLIEIMRQVSCTRYISGPSAKSYLNYELFQSAGYEVEYMVYEYPEYDQLYPPFDPFVSILDLLFMKGEKAINYFCKEELIRVSQ